MIRRLIILLLIVGCEEALEPEDCAGVAGGSAVVDNCEVCDADTTNDNTTCTQDCADVWGGTAVEDDCGICNGIDGYIAGSCYDCADVPDGNSEFDNCGVCDNDPANDCVMDCAGVWGGNHSDEDCGIVTDFDGNTYKTIQIGEQIWMAENLKVTHYRNGDEIPTGHNHEEWISLTIDRYNGIGTGAYTFYNNETFYFNIYGNLYNWYAAMDERGICPEGWRIPSKTDWNGLIENLTPDSLSGGMLKEQGNEHWEFFSDEITQQSTNESGFNGLPGGTRKSSVVSPNEGSNGFAHIGYVGYFASTYFNDYDGKSHPFHLSYSHSSHAGLYPGSGASDGFSIRCLKD